MKFLAFLFGAGVAVALIGPKLSTRPAAAMTLPPDEWRPVLDSSGILKTLNFDWQTGGTMQSYVLPARGQAWADAFQYHEMVNNLPPGLLARMAQQESNFNPLAVSPAGAKGLMQFMDATWQEWGGGYDVFDPLASIDAAGRYMAWLFDYFQDWQKAVAAYNFGIGNVSRGRTWPTETVKYVENIGKDINLATV